MTERIRLISYNVARLGATSKDPTPTEEALQATSATLRELDGKSVALQEVPSEDALRELARRSGYAHAVFVKSNDPTHHHLGFLSTRPLEATESHAERLFDGQKFSRDVAVVSMELTPARRARFLNGHLKADPFYLKPTTPEKKAEAVRLRGREALELGQIVVENQARYPREAYVVGLDQNAPAGAPELRGLPGVDPLPDVASHPARGQRIDALRVSAELAGCVAAAFVHDSESARRASDHLPVVLDLTFPGEALDGPTANREIHTDQVGRGPDHEGGFERQPLAQLEATHRNPL